MQLEQIMAYLDGQLPEAARPEVEAFLATPEGQRTREALGLFRRAVQAAGPSRSAEPCEHLEEVCALVDGALGHEERSTVESHLLECSNCFQAWLDLSTAALPGDLTTPAEVLERAQDRDQGSGIRDQGEKVISFRPALFRPTSDVRPPTYPVWRGGLIGSVAAAVLLFVLWRPTLESHFQLPAGPGAPSGPGHAVTTGTGMDKDLPAWSVVPGEAGGQQALERRVNTLLQVLQQEPGNVNARQELARLYERIGKKELAIKHYHLLQEEMVHRGLFRSKNYAGIRERLRGLERMRDEG